MNALSRDNEGLERPRGLEPPPGAWQAPVLPLYYGRLSNIETYNTLLMMPQATTACSVIALAYIFGRANLPAQPALT
jgi:hypothetical protein